MPAESEAKTSVTGLLYRRVNAEYGARTFELLETRYQAYDLAVAPPCPGMGGTNSVIRVNWSRVMF